MTDPYEKVLDRIADGASLAAACNAPGAPHRRAVQKRRRTDAAFGTAYEMAVQDRAEIRAQRYSDILDKLETGHIDPSSARVLLDGIKFQMVNDDRRYAEKTRTELTGRDGAPLIAETKPMSDFETARLIAYVLSSAKSIDGGELLAIGSST